MTRKMSEKVNKLSRKRTLRRGLNRSSDDFADEPPLRAKRSKENFPPQPQPSASSTRSTSETQAQCTIVEGQEGLPDCPICGKGFKGVSQRMKASRTSHLKSCGTKSGFDAEKLLQIRRLEEKQAEERIALGLPPIPPIAQREDETVASKSNSTVRSNKSVRAPKTSLVRLQGFSSKVFFLFSNPNFFIYSGGSWIEVYHPCFSLRPVTPNWRWLWPCPPPWLKAKWKPNWRREMRSRPLGSRSTRPSIPQRRKRHPRSFSPNSACLTALRQNRGRERAAPKQR